MHCVTSVLFLLALADLVFRGNAFSQGSTCQNRCNGGFGSPDDFTCQCNGQCVKYNDCCDDYQQLCLGSRPSSETCKTLSQMGQTLWDSDVNRLSSKDLTTNYQTKFRGGYSSDNAADKFFKHIDEAKLTSPTYSTFLKLLDNYNPKQKTTEHSNSQEKKEMNSFLDAVLGTKVMAELLDFLICQSKVTSKADLRKTLKKIWFDFFRRSSKYAYDSTSGFEHILVGEYKDSKTVSGFHSWLSFYQKEKSGKLNYLGYVSKNNPDVVGAAYLWNGHLKNKSSFFVGTSPEFDMAVYTLCYLMHKDSVCRLTLNGHKVAIRTFGSNGHIATAYIMS